MEDIEAILQKLIAFPTVSDDFEANHRALNFVAEYLSKAGMYVERWPRNEKMHEALYATTRKNRKHPAILLAGHIDVMPAPPHMFHLKKEDGKYIGRGVLDMKCALAAYLEIVNSLRDALAQYDFALLITSDEELGGRDNISGVVEFLSQGYRPGFVILPDGGDNWQLEVASSGFLHVTLEAHGVTGHSSRPWLGDNAVHRLIDVLHECRALFQDEGPETNTLNIASIKTSDVPANQIPDYACVDLSVRLRHLGNLQHVLAAINSICRKHRVTVTERVSREVTYNDLENPCVRKFADITEDVTGVQVTGFHSYAGSDARFFGELGIPYANGYPAGGGHHGSNEWITQASLDQLREIIERYIRETQN